jgi:hypothetical protein
MSAYTTLKITRTKAILLLMSKLNGGPSDEMLEDFLDGLLRERLYNARIVPDGEENDDDQV